MTFDFDDVNAAALVLTGQPLLTVLRDSVALAHLAAMAVGLGTVLRTDLAMAAHLGRPLTRARLQMVESAHRVILGAFGLMWLTGLTLVWIKTGGVLAAVTPKLVAKLATVSILLAVAASMTVWGLPILRGALGRRLLDLRLGQKMVLGICAGLSVGGWGTALALGAAAVLQSLGTRELVVVLGLGFGLPIGGFGAAVLLQHGLQWIGQSTRQGASSLGRSAAV